MMRIGRFLSFPIRNPHLNQIKDYSEITVTDYSCDWKTTRTPFRVLHENGVLEDVLSETMADAAKFGNVIVHHYSRIEPGIVVTVLNRHPDAFADYRNAITDILKQE